MQQFRRTVLVTAVAAVTIPFTGARYGALERYDFDTSHTHVGFSVRHLAVTNVKGNFNRFSGHIMLDEQDITKSTVDVTIETASIDTDNERRDTHLRSADFFEAEKYPAITFRGNRVERTADGLVLVGDLTMRDVTKEVRIPFEMAGPTVSSNGQKRIGAEGTLRINRFDYGVNWNSMREAIAVVGDEVRIQLDISAATPRAR